jgi:hypothetical protein
VIDALGEEVRRYPKLLGVVLSHRSGTITLGQHAIVNKSLADAVQKQAVILINEDRSSPVMNDTRQKIERAFT